MRKPEYLSPSSISTYYKDPDDYYTRYLSDNKSERMPQTEPMAIGSAFDAFVKSYLHESLIGKSEEFGLKTLFENQVEEQHWDWAWKHGRYAFETYKDLGALADLVLDLEKAVGEPKFEIEIKNHVGGVPLLGKPDLYYINSEGHAVILDWKVNGWFSSRSVSPSKGFVNIRGDKKSGPHKDAVIEKHRGMMINVSRNLEDVNDGWASQLAVYGWLCGEEIGSDFITAIDQIVCKNSGSEFPYLRVAEHRTVIGKDFQNEFLNKAVNLWDVVNSDHYFRDLSLEESKVRCAALDAKSSGDDEFNILTRGW